MFYNKPLYAVYYSRVRYGLSVKNYMTVIMIYSLSNYVGHAAEGLLHMLQVVNKHYHMIICVVRLFMTVFFLSVNFGATQQGTK